MRPTAGRLVRDATVVDSKLLKKKCHHGHSPIPTMLTVGTLWTYARTSPVLEPVIGHVFSRHGAFNSFGTFNPHSTDSDKLLVHLQKGDKFPVHFHTWGTSCWYNQRQHHMRSRFSSSFKHFFLISPEKISPGSSLGLTSVRFQNWAYRPYISIFRSVVGTFPESGVSSVHFQFPVCRRYISRFGR